MKNGRLFIVPLTMDFGGSENETWTDDTKHPAEGLTDIGRLSPR